MSLTLFLVALRFFLYSILIRPLWILPVELISGFGLSMTYVVMASFSSVLALPGTESTVQAIFGAIFDGLGVYKIFCSYFSIVQHTIMMHVNGNLWYCFNLQVYRQQEYLAESFTINIMDLFYLV